MINFLHWDTDFFKRKIGRVDVLNKLNLKEFYNEAKYYDLVYVFAENPLDFNANLVDVKLTYVKRTLHENINFAINHKIERFDSQKHNYRKLLELVYLSGHESRFFKDPFFGENNFKKLYETWINKNINEIKNDVLIYNIDDRIAGFVSFSNTQKKASIELIAVDPVYQGLGLGIKLMKAVENLLPKNFVLTVPTQESNKKACKFYLKYGFKLHDKKYVYHFVDDKNTAFK